MGHKVIGDDDLFAGFTYREHRFYFLLFWRRKK